MNDRVTVLILSRNRPIYLWACLDALYRNTRAPCRFALVDLGSDDPLVDTVIKGFERRGMFHDVLRADRNDPSIIIDYALARLGEWGDHFAYVESDAVVETSHPCWLSRMSSIMRDNPRLAMLGSAIDASDFVDPASVEHLRAGRGDAHWRGLIKADSPERSQDVAQAFGRDTFRPHNPAGRLMMLRTQALKQVGVHADSVLDQRLRDAGFETAIATGVRHRHLSLLHVYDYDDYDVAARDEMMASVRREN